MIDDVGIIKRALIMYGSHCLNRATEMAQKTSTDKYDRPFTGKDVAEAIDEGQRALLIAKHLRP